MYCGVFHLSRSVQALIDELQRVVEAQVNLCESLFELDGQIEMLIGGLSNTLQR
jgi:hypothetical protein